MLKRPPFAGDLEEYEEEAKRKRFLFRTENINSWFPGHVVSILLSEAREREGRSSSVTVAAAALPFIPVWYCGTLAAEAARAR